MSVQWAIYPRAVADLVQISGVGRAPDWIRVQRATPVTGATPHLTQSAQSRAQSAQSAQRSIFQIWVYSTNFFAYSGASPKGELCVRN
jgi:hypothetical protein